MARRIAFYAPLKPPTHPVPSGDREMARNLMDLLGRDGAEIVLASTLRTHDKTGDPDHQADLLRAAGNEADRLTRDWRAAPFDLWVTYHNYYKAPDLLGPVLSRRFKIPYVQIEATRAASRLTGPWARFAKAAHDASDAASVIFFLTANDLIALKRDSNPAQRLVHLPPFLPRDDLPSAADCAAPGRPMLTAGMMRAGDKAASYAILAEALGQLETPDWHLEIAGDGPDRSRVEELMAPFGDKVCFLGQLDRAQMAQAYNRASLFVWPGVNEAFGMVYLEAQAAGLPVVAQDRPGVRDVLAQTANPRPEDGPAALSRRIDALLRDPQARQAAASAGRDHVLRRHLAPQAAATLSQAIHDLGTEAT